DIDSRAIVVHFSGVATLFCIVALGVFPCLQGDSPGNAKGVFGSFSGLDAIALLSLLGIGVTATVGQLFLTLAFGSGQPSRVAVLGLTQIVFGLLLEHWFWPEKKPLNAMAMVGIVLVMAPTAWVLLYRPSSEGHEEPAPQEPVPETDAADEG